MLVPWTAANRNNSWHFQSLSQTEQGNNLAAKQLVCGLGLSVVRSSQISSKFMLNPTQIIAKASDVPKCSPRRQAERKSGQCLSMSIPVKKPRVQIVSRHFGRPSPCGSNPCSLTLSGELLGQNAEQQPQGSRAIPLTQKHL